MSKAFFCKYTDLVLVFNKYTKMLIITRTICYHSKIHKKINKRNAIFPLEIQKYLCRGGLLHNIWKLHYHYAVLTLPFVFQSLEADFLIQSSLGVSPPFLGRTLLSALGALSGAAQVLVTYGEKGKYYENHVTLGFEVLKLLLSLPYLPFVQSSTQRKG